ncbi:fungal Zn(2)-Cys(6) binuclear cluster domain-containing protein 10 [Elsinoe australis]|uniref:Fungal Zn(2)-Cys(6) binuclear cluster domain-containing protein 10 n=1 Tax=Elsinoe australis TaxID=40998 RepID=A0A4U7AZG0_9PEZI|nr:fungal Zn(2)-Cys(6) binuclear cluster domain-containing protein 10 [Elsinoe australis]
MYPNPGQTGQWTPNPPPPSSSAGPQQGQQQWAPPPQQSPQGQPQPNGQYRGPPQQIPPITQSHQQGPAMATLQPQHPDQYRSLPPPGAMYAHSPYHPQPPIQYPPQPAPRQRTAIACRYCRRRKIRCSGFDQSEDGRCTNCQRFSQECIFTPVSQQTQAFVPAHAVMRNQGQMPPQLYGAYGQPLPQGQYGYPPQYAPPPNGYQHPPPGYGPPMQPGPPGQQPPQQPGMAPPNHQVQQSPQQQQNVQAAGQKRPNEEPHTPTQAPPNPANHAQMGQGQQRSASGEQDHESHATFDLSSLTQAALSTASSTTSFNAQPGQPQYYANNGTPQQHVQHQQQPHATPPQNNNYTHEAQPKQERHNTASPQAGGNAGSYPAPTSDPNSRPPQAGQDGTASPNDSAKNGVRISELVGNGGAQVPSSPAQSHAQQGNQAQGQAQTGQQKPDSPRLRSSADSDMLSQLNKRVNG